MYDQKNLPDLRPGYRFVGSAASPILNGDVGLWSLNGKLLQRRAGPPYVDQGIMAQRGIIPAARLTAGTPVNANVFQIGAGTYQFVTALTTIQTYTQIKVLGTAALSQAAAVNAINGAVDANVVQGSTVTVEKIVADLVSANLIRIRLADARGGNAIPGVALTTALTATIGGGGVWSVANLISVGKLASDCHVTEGSVTITAGMVTAAAYQVELPFTPTAFFAFVASSAGVQRASTDAVTISGNALNIALAGGASPAIQAGDTVYFRAIE